MVEIGKYNTLKIVKDLDFGVYLDGGDGMEILLPARYVPKTKQAYVTQYITFSIGDSVFHWYSRFSMQLAEKNS